jgi:hypothetical protein
MSQVTKKVEDTEYVLVWVPASKEVLEHNYIDTIDFRIVSVEELKKLVDALQGGISIT